MKSKLFTPLFALTIIFFSASGCQLRTGSQQGGDYQNLLSIGGAQLRVAMAGTPQQQIRGLSGREKMEAGQGMIFPLEPPAKVGFWMKDMKFNLDLIWIKNHKIIFITTNVPAPKSPAEHLPIYYPPSPVDEVLEVNAGWAERNKIKIGDDVRLQKFQIPNVK